MSSPLTAPDPSRRVKELDQPKISVPLTPMPSSVTGSDARRRELEDRRDGGSRDGDESSAPLSTRSRHPDDPIDIPTEGAPQWLIVMMIASALACITIAGYYLLKP